MYIFFTDGYKRSPLVDIDCKSQHFQVKRNGMDNQPHMKMILKHFCNVLENLYKYKLLNRVENILVREEMA